MITHISKTKFSYHNCGHWLVVCLYLRQLMNPCFLIVLKSTLICTIDIQQYICYGSSMCCIRYHSMNYWWWASVTPLWSLNHCVLGTSYCVTYPGQQGRIQDLKLGVAQMDWKIWKPGGGGGGNCINYKYFVIYIFKYDICQIGFLFHILSSIT